MIRIEDVIAGFPKRPGDFYKGDAGHVFIVAGSVGYTGAAYLVSQAAALAGGGLVTLAVGRTIYPILASKLTEVMVRPFIETKDGSLSLMAERDIFSWVDRCDVLAVGPGISLNKDTQNLVYSLVAKTTKPTVLDADALTACSSKMDILKKKKAPLVMTPHPGEFARLIEKDVTEVQERRKELALAFANEYNTVLVLKGHETVVARPDGEFYINMTGNPGMATGGTGDVLTGIIAGFIGQGMDAFYAACLGVYMHGASGDAALKAKGALSLLATDLLHALPEQLKTLA